ncbi:hypothetical protein F2Q68_00045137 [Brassica cretica]|uniref:Uncharacterized protein n=1 Tax=Brassica cretica TaxID=69181 RepID=A0A8S9LTV5_BRACR|nr:hypothetical protein F2Q68_00045137 [Brassica cretica]
MENIYSRPLKTDVSAGRKVESSWANGIKSDKGGEPLHHRRSLNCNLITGPPDLTQIRLKPHKTLQIPSSLASHHG